MAANKILFRGDILVSDSITNLKKISTDYFVKQGFKEVMRTESKLSFKRGNIFLNMVTMNPLKWKSKFTLLFEEGKISTDFEINTIYQMVSSQEEKVWFNFVHNYHQSVTTGKLQLPDNKKLIKKAKRAVLKHFGYALLGGFLFGVPGIIISYYTGIHAIATGLGVGGAMFFLNRSVEKDKEKADE